MNINTDLVKSKKFSSVVAPNNLKKSQEYRVLATLRYLYPTNFDKMIKGEAPDLQDSANSTGIEVVSAVKEADMKISRELSKLPKDIEKQKNLIKSSGYSFVPLKDGKFAISSSGTADGEKRIFQDIIRKKAEKLQNYRTNFKRIGLAIIFPEIPTSYAENYLFKWISEIFDESANMFDFVYVISHRFCLHYDKQMSIAEKRSLSQYESRSLATIGRMTAEKELSLTDIEWL